MVTQQEILTSLIGNTINNVTGLKEGSDLVTFVFTDGTELQLYHRQGCCEVVEIVQLDGDVDDLIGSKLLLADIVEGADKPDSYTADYARDSETWTFYRFATVKGYVTVRWLGRSNGYYSEAVNMCFNGKDIVYG